MPVRTGAQFLEGLAARRTHVQVQGDTLHGGVASHPAFAGVVRSYAALFDQQHDPAYRDGADRVRLFRLVWDTCASAFASRQALYEYYFFGDPVRTASAYAAGYDASPYTARVRDFLAASGDIAPGH